MKLNVLLRSGLAAFVLWVAAQTAHAAELRPVAIGLSTGSIASAAPRIAAELGLFKNHGLDAKITIMDSASISTSALIAGSLDFAFVNPTDAVLAAAHGQNLVVVRSVYSGFPAVLILSKAVADGLKVSPTAPVEARLKALDGLTIASISATSSYTVSLKGATEAVGSHVRFTYMAQPAMVAALQTGAVQGFVASSPYHATAVLNGSGEVWLSGPKGEYPPQFSLSSSITAIAKRDFAVANPALIASLNAVFDDLAKVVEERPGDIKAAVGKLFPDLDAKTLDLILAAELKSFIGSKVTVEDIRHSIRFLQLSGASLPPTLDPAAMLLP